MSPLKYNLVTPEMIRKMMGFGRTDDQIVLKGQAITCETMANELNEMIHERCLYCDEGDSNCQCWNDE